MRFNVFLTTVLLCFSSVFARPVSEPQLSLKNLPEAIDIDSLLNSYVIMTKNFSDTLTQKLNDSIPFPIPNKGIEQKEKLSFSDSIIKNQDVLLDTIPRFYLTKNPPLLNIDSLVLYNNPFFIDLVFTGIDLDFNWKKPDFSTLYYGKPAAKFTDLFFKLPPSKKDDQVIYDLRNDIRKEITRNAVDLYCTTFDRLPNANKNRSKYISAAKIDRVDFVDDKIYNHSNKINLKDIKASPWFYKSSALAQFSQNYVSPNWYQGGNSNIAILGILSGKLNYDNKKSIQWDNNAEWRMGFNSIEGDTIHPLSTNDDVFKINSKLGIKAGGKWFYSGSVDFSTQFFNSYKGINSNDMKASFLTPVRFSIGVGLDYKYKKMLSLMISPISYKYIFVNDTIRLNQNLFGVKKGFNYLSELGSSFKAVISYPITHEIQLDSKFSFYTNYEKVEIDWEIVCNMSINRFMSTRISFNPRYDNTIIGETPKMQLKQLLSVGFSHKFN